MPPARSQDWSFPWSKKRSPEEQRKYEVEKDEKMKREREKDEQKRETALEVKRLIARKKSLQKEIPKLFTKRYYDLSRWVESVRMTSDYPYSEQERIKNAKIEKEWRPLAEKVGSLQLELANIEKLLDDYKKGKIVVNPNWKYNMRTLVPITFPLRAEPERQDHSSDKTLEISDQASSRPAVETSSEDSEAPPIYATGEGDLGRSLYPEDATTSEDGAAIPYPTGTTSTTRPKQRKLMTRPMRVAATSRRSSKITSSGTFLRYRDTGTGRFVSMRTRD